MAANLSEQAVLDALRRVPVERWDEVLHFLEALSNAGPAVGMGADLLQSGLVGLWADRDDLGDSREFARRLRQQAETRRGVDAAGH